MITLATQGAPLLGVVSTAPGLILGSGPNTLDFHRYPIALSGRVPVQVNHEGGAIKIGDRITISSIPGIGTKATTTWSHTIGIALEDNPIESASTTVLVFISRQNGLTETSLATTYALAGGTSTQPINLFTWDGTTGAVKYLAEYTLDLTGHTLANVDSISSASGTWSIDAEGRVTAESVTAKKVEAMENICVDGVCITKEQWQTLLQGAGITPVSSGGSSSNSTPASTPVSAPTSTSSGTSSSETPSPVDPTSVFLTPAPVDIPPDPAPVPDVLNNPPVIDPPL